MMCLWFGQQFATRVNRFHLMYESGFIKHKLSSNKAKHCFSIRRASTPNWRMSGEITSLKVQPD